MDIVTIDFETYYDKDYTLSKMTTESYIRDNRFEVIGVAVKINNNRTEWYSGGDVRSYLHNIDFSDKAILAHNTAFDGAILSWIYGIKPRLWLDTMSMAKPYHHMTIGCSLAMLSTQYKLGSKGDEVISAKGMRREDFTPEQLERYRDYCINDVDLTYKLFGTLKVGFPPTEIQIIDQTIRMYTEPTIELDTDVLESHLKTIVDNKTKLIDNLGYDSPHEEILKSIMSNDKFSALLKWKGVEPPTKISLRTGKTAWAFAKTDQAFTNLLTHDDPDVRALVQARLGLKSTIEETRTNSLLAVASRGRLPILLHYYGAHTGRFSGGDKLNLQNLPRNGAIRRAITPPKDHVLIACDSSQIEARVTAYISGQEDLVEAFRDGRDVYSEFASEIYGRKITKANRVERFVGKTCILGLGYGMGAEKFKDTLSHVVDIEPNEAQRIVRLYRQKNHKIVSFWQRCNYILGGMVSGASGQITDLDYGYKSIDIAEYDGDGIKLPNGLKIRYPALRSQANGYEYINNSRSYRKIVADRVTGNTQSKNDWTKIYGGKVTENIVQALARIIIAEQMVEIGKLYHVAFQVHDEVVVIVPVHPSQLTHAQQHIVMCMSEPPSWAPNIPISCEIGSGSNYADAK